MGRARIVVADDHQETRAQIAALLASDFDVVSTVAEGTRKRLVRILRRDGRRVVE